MNYLQAYPEPYNWFILTIVIMSIIFKALHDAVRYKRDKQVESSNPDSEKIKYYGKMYHWYGFIYFVIPFFITLIIKMTAEQFIISMFGFAFIYLFLLPTAFNLLTGHKPSYIGHTETTDIWLRNKFKIFDKGTKEFDELTAKEVQRMNFRVFIIFFVRFLIFVIGISIFLDLV